MLFTIIVCPSILPSPGSTICAEETTVPVVPLVCPVIISPSVKVPVATPHVNVCWSGWLKKSIVCKTLNSLVPGVVEAETSVSSLSAVVGSTFKFTPS